MRDLWKKFWSFKTKWNRVPFLLYWGAWVATCASSIFIRGDQFRVQRGTTTLIFMASAVPLLIKMLLDFRRMNRDWKSTQFELRVRSIIREDNLRAHEEDELADLEKKFRKELLERI